jgi:hypothetical protein
MRVASQIARLTAVALLVACAHALAEDQILDLTKTPHWGFHPLPTKTSGKPASSQVPLRVRLLKTDRKAYRRMEMVSYDVSLENISKNPVVIPWSPDRFGDGPLARASARLVLAFVLTRRDGTDALIEGVALYGTPDLPGSLKTLAPGERVVIRAPAHLTGDLLPQDATSPILNPSVEVRAKATVLFDAPGDPLSKSFGAHGSENTLPFRIAPTVAPLPVTTEPQRPPAVLRVSPDSVSAGGFVRVDGYRLGADRAHPARPSPAPPAQYFFSNGLERVPARRHDATFTGAGNDPSSRQQMVSLVTPALKPGAWNIVVELDGQEGTSLSPIQITDWIPPQLDRISPSRVNPGAAIVVTASHLGFSDLIEMIDAGGNLHATAQINASGTGGIIFVSPNEPESEGFMRVLSRRNGDTFFSQPVAYVVQHAPLTPTIRNQASRSAGSGQWIAVEGIESLNWSERTEVEFSQGGQLVVTETAAPTSNRVQLPTAVNPGLVTVRARIWHGGTASEWSQSATYRVALGAVPPLITGVMVGPELQQRVNLSVADPPARFDVVRGDPVGLLGFLPVAATAAIPVSLERGHESIPIATTRPDANTVRFTLPARLATGAWTIVLGAVGGTPALTLPITMYVR